MLVDYKLKTLQFSVKGNTVHLQGVQDNPNVCTPVSASKLKGLLKHGAISHCIHMIVPSVSQHCSDQDQTVKQHNIPASVAEVLSKHAHLFSEPVDLPPSRSADHRIPLIPGAQRSSSNPTATLLSSWMRLSAKSRICCIRA